MSDLPIACTLTPDDLQVRRRGLLAEVLRRAERQELTADGIRLQFAADSDALTTITQAVDAERQCCRFLRFAITVDPDSGPIGLELSGPPGTGEFIAGLLDVLGAKTTG
jgi:hypothetical protein